MELSIIIPIYNTDLFKLERCFASVKNIIGPEYECLLIDDGSEFVVAEFCKEYAEKNQNFKYVRKLNRGVSSARNEGIIRAKGRYIYFVDSDDEIIPSFFCNITDIANEPDLIFTDLILVDENRKSRWSGITELSYEKIIERMIMDGKLNGPYAKFWKTEFLKQNNVMFDEQMVSGEDAFFLLSCIEYKPKMEYINVDTYFYHKEIKSGENRIVKDPQQCIEDCQKKYYKILTCIEKGRYNKKQKRFLNIKEVEQLIRELFDLQMTMVKINVLKPEIQDDFVQIIDDLDKNDLKQISIKNKLRVNIVTKTNMNLKKTIANLRKCYIRIKGLG